MFVGEDDDRSEVYELLKSCINSRIERFPPRHSYGKL